MPGGLPGRTEVTCIACGAEVRRSEAREYDKHGDRWERDGKSFEYLCKSCFRELSKTPRDGLESALVTAEAEASDRGGFVRRYLDVLEDRTPDEPEPDRD